MSGQTQQEPAVVWRGTGAEAVDALRRAVLAELMQDVTGGEESTTTGQIIPSGCAHCGLGQYEHGQRWAEAAGWHRYAPPSAEQVKQRMIARRRAEQTEGHDR